MNDQSFLNILALRVSPELLLFAGQALLVLLAVIGAVGGIIILVSNVGVRQRSGARLEVKSINDEWAERKRSLESMFVSKKEWKAKIKSDRETEKQRASEGTEKKRLWVLDFQGDIEASANEALRYEITSILELVGNQTDKSQDAVLIRLESPGGTVTGYGLAASQLARLRKAGVHLTVAIDEVAASGGYMMAAVADRIVASPFAVLGSIGVIGQLPNVHRLLKKHDVDYLEVTAGQHKRPVSMLGPLTDEGVAKFRSQIEDTHALFREHIRTYRPALDIDKTATGDIWHGIDAMKLGLIDELATSDEILDRARRDENRDIFQLTWKPNRGWRSRLEESVSVVVEKAVNRSLQKMSIRPSEFFHF